MTGSRFRTCQSGDFLRYAIVDETAIAEGLGKVHRLRQREAEEPQERTVVEIRRGA